MFNKRNNEREDMNTPNEPSNTPNPTPASQPAPATGNAATTVLAEGCQFDGKANVQGTLRVEGNVKGNIDASDSLVVAKSGEVKAEAKVRRAVVNGRFEGKIDAADCVELQSGGRVEAEIKAKNMVMEDGAQFEGHCKIGS